MYPKAGQLNMSIRPFNMASNIKFFLSCSQLLSEDLPVLPEYQQKERNSCNVFYS
jgi:hypothetical protein